MYVGFVGVSGSGKSTIACATKAQLEQAGYKVALYAPFFNPERSRWYRIMWAIYLWRWFNPRLCYFFVWQKPSHINLYHMGWSVYLSLMTSYYLNMVRKGVYDVVIFDEEVIKWSANNVSEGYCSLTAVTSFYSGHVAPRVRDVLLVRVDTPVVESTERFVARPENIARGHVREKVYQEQARLRNNADALLQDVVANTPATELTVDGTGVVAEEAARIVTHVTNHPSSTAS